jgi:hypothetical protein
VVNSVEEPSLLKDKFVEKGSVIQMGTSQKKRKVKLNSGLVIAGAALAVVGGLACFAGTALGVSAIVSAARRWVGELDQPPSEIAKSTWKQAKAASLAGTDAWRQSTSSPSLTNGGS